MKDSLVVATIRPKARGRQSTAGFTLLELAVVLLVIGTLAILATPGLRHVLARSRTAEARTLLEAIAHAELGHRRDHGAFIACEPSADAVPRGAQVRFNSAAPGWAALGVEIDGPVWYRYAVVLDGDDFVAVAEGDQDADGTTARFELGSATLQLRAKDELE
jgi:prepilin-type N-terminal cleavage/methylation domain-containing protein